MKIYYPNAAFKQIGTSDMSMFLQTCMLRISACHMHVTCSFELLGMKHGESTPDKYCLACCSCGCFPASACIMHWLCVQQLVLTYLDLAFSASFCCMYCLHAALDGSLRPLKPGCMQVGQPFWLPLHLMQPNGPLCTAFIFLDSVVLAFAWAAAGLFMPEGWAADGLFLLFVQVLVCFLLILLQCLLGLVLQRHGSKQITRQHPKPSYKPLYKLQTLKW